MKFLLHFGISGTIVAASDVYELYSRAKKIKNKYFPDKNKLIFHYTETLNKKEDFARFKNNYQKYRAYTDSLKSFVVNSRFKFSCVFVDKHELIKKYGMFDKTGRILKIKNAKGHYKSAATLACPPGLDTRRTP